MNLELIGEIVFKTLAAQMAAFRAWSAIPSLHVQSVRGVIRVYKVVQP